MVLSAGIQWLDSNVATYFAQEDFGPDLPLWDKITSFAELGSDAWPAVVDVKGVLVGGTFNGPETDYRAE